VEIRLRTLTPLWTGGVDRTPDRLHETGLIGSLRWWYEALVRGLGGYACDPTSDDRCPDHEGKHCAACEVFGCTSWARKFRLQILDEHDVLLQSSPQKDQDLQLHFIELRPMQGEEKWLLLQAVKICAQYGALGGKTTLKPQQGKVGADYGIVKIISVNPDYSQAPANLSQYLASFRQVMPTDAPDLRWFFFIQGGFLWRIQMNRLLGLDKNGRLLSKEDWQLFLRGERGGPEKPAKSKKIFSFQTDGGRIWGYAASREMRDRIINEIKKYLKEEFNVKTGEEVLNAL
jgi:CRISPR-associated protein Cmr1